MTDTEPQTPLKRAREPGSELSVPDWKRRQAVRPAPPRYIEPTLPERINRLNPVERREVQSLLRNMKLRKIVKRTLAEAYWSRDTVPSTNASAPNSTEAEKLGEFSKSYARELTPSGSATTVPVVLK